MRVKEGEDSDTRLLEMPRGSPAEICVRINPGDRVLGYLPCLLSPLSLPSRSFPSLHLTPRARNFAKRSGRGAEQSLLVMQGRDAR
jgi:hypothetical protein